MERAKVVQSESEGAECDGIRILGISKTYSKGSCRSKKVRALKEVYLKVSRGEILALLGCDGAGKSTLVNVLAGILGSDSGSARVFNMSLHENVEEVQCIMGFVPQFDILWDELTAAEHLAVFAQLRGIPSDEIPDLVKTKLAEVKLEGHEDGHIRTFSNGMKRRLSIAIATIGNPRILIMDEPTTAIDSLNTMHMWKLINVLALLPRSP